ncbi:MAG: hypothetical protein EB060_10940 [Proteobacteria bacterium]|nr:hypothetical protein [Pseudomonadota bacterium]
MDFRFWRKDSGKEPDKRIEDDPVPTGSPEGVSDYSKLSEVPADSSSALDPNDLGLNESVPDLPEAKPVQKEPVRPRTELVEPVEMRDSYDQGMTEIAKAEIETYLRRLALITRGGKDMGPEVIESFREVADMSFADTQRTVNGPIETPAKKLRAGEGHLLQGDDALLERKDFVGQYLPLKELIRYVNNPDFNVNGVITQGFTFASIDPFQYMLASPKTLKEAIDYLDEKGYRSFGFMAAGGYKLVSNTVEDRLVVLSFNTSIDGKHPELEKPDHPALLLPISTHDIGPIRIQEYNQLDTRNVTADDVEKVKASVVGSGLELVPVMVAGRIVQGDIREANIAKLKDGTPMLFDAMLKAPDGWVCDLTADCVKDWMNEDGTRKRDTLLNTKRPEGVVTGEELRGIESVTTGTIAGIVKQGRYREQVGEIAEAATARFIRDGDTEKKDWLDYVKEENARVSSKKGPKTGPAV